MRSIVSQPPTLPVASVEADDVSARDLALVLRALRVIAILAAAWFAYRGRASMSPDSVSYLDIGAAFTRGDWTNAISSYWGPIFPWLLGTCVAVLRAQGVARFAVIHALNFIFFVATTLVFHRFLLAMLDATSATVRNTRLRFLAVILAYSIFVYTFIPVMTQPGPDMLLAFVILSAGFALFKYSTGSDRWLYAAGFLFGFGYLVKAIMLPVGAATLAVAGLVEAYTTKKVRCTAVSFLAMLLSASPLIASLSIRAGHLSTGDTGRLAYAWFVNTPISESSSFFEARSFFPLGQIIHSQPKIYSIPTRPDVTFLPWFDPSELTRDVKPRFNYRDQARVLGRTLKDYRNLILFNGYGFVIFSLLLLALCCRRDLVKELKLLVPIAFSAAALGAYALILVEPRYVYPFGFVLFLFVLAAELRNLSQENLQFAIKILSVAIVAFALQAFPTLIFRALTSEPVNPTHDKVARFLHAHGVQPGDKVAVSGWPYYQYWAKLSDVSLSAYIQAPELTDYCDSNGQPRSELVEILTSTGAKWFVPEGDLSGCSLDAWQLIPGTPYRVLRLRQSQEGK